MDKWPYEDHEDPWSSDHDDKRIPIVATRTIFTPNNTEPQWLLIKGAKLAIAFIVAYNEELILASKKGQTKLL
eukprot:16433416-Heterocapsa_arctica.AAC.1